MASQTKPPTSSTVKPVISTDDSAASPPVGAVDFGSLRRVTPVSRVFGFDRGGCIDRYYIERFLASHAADIHGRVLEVADNEYTRRFGGDRVTQSDVLHATPGNRKATIVADLASGDGIPAGAFDGIILTQTLQHIHDTRAVIATLHRSLAAGGVVLVTVPGISQISRYDMERWGDFWRFTTLSARRLFEDVFDAREIHVEAHGNVLVACAFMHGLAADELNPEELNHHDPDYQVLITIRAKKTGASL